MAFSPLLLVRQKFPDRRIPDIPSEVQREMSSANLAGGLKPGSSVAIGVGSRGITNLSIIVRAAVDYWKSQGMQPFIFPAMGSHGAGTAEGQADVLAHYGITAATMGCPVVSQLEVVSLGRTEEGIETFMDRAAYESGGVMLVGRVKWHTDFDGKIESGLYKMMAIGVGKFAGAQYYHGCAYKIGLERMILEVGRQILKSGKMIGGLAILEDAYHNTGKLSAVRVEEMERREMELLALVKSWKPNIPVGPLDLLIVDEMGKNISGAGMDTKIINRGVHGEYNLWPGVPAIERIFVRTLTDLSYGNGVGVGLADITTNRLVDRIDWEATHINALTSTALPAVRTPIHLASDLQCLEKIWPTVGKFRQEELRIGWIRNTLELSLVVLSGNMRAEIERNPELEIAGEPHGFEFDAAGNLLSPLAAEMAAAH